MENLDHSGGMIEEKPSADLCQQLREGWNQALGGSLRHQSDWRIVEGGTWNWTNEGVTVHKDGGEWAGFAWQACGPQALGQLRNFLAETTVKGRADAAGLSFGPFKDFLVPVNDSTGPRRLQVEVDGGSGTWGLRADDLLAGVLGLKALQAEDVTFSALTVYRFASSCRLSVIVTCYRYVQRLRIALQNWCSQQLASGALEILVVNPESPDGTTEHLAA